VERPAPSFEDTYKNHLYPELGDKRLDAIDDEDVQRLKGRLADRHRKTVNNVLGVLGHTLRTAVRWKVIDRVPCSVTMLKVGAGLPKFYDFDDYKRLVEAADAIDARAHLVVLLGGDAWLRRGDRDRWRCDGGTSTSSGVNLRCRNRSGSASFATGAATNVSPTRPRAAGRASCPWRTRSGKRFMLTATCAAAGPHWSIRASHTARFVIGAGDMCVGTRDGEPDATSDAPPDSDVQRWTNDFSLVLGGPLYQLYLRTRLARPPLELLRRRILAFVGITLLPPALLSALTGRLASGPVPFLLDLTNLQFVTTLPLLIGAEVFIHYRLRLLVPEFVGRDLVAAEDRSRFDDFVVRALQLRNSPAAEVVILLLAFTGGYWLWRMYASLHVPTWYMVPVDGTARLTEAGYWLAFVSLPISRFILLRWYFRLFIWYQFLWRVSRLRLRLNPLHADRAGGLGFLANSAMAYAPVLIAQSTFFATVLGSQIWHMGARLSDFRYEVLAFVVFLLFFVLFPLTFFAKQMNAAKVRGIRQYGRLASRYTNAFHEKWLAAGESHGEPLLGTGDIQSLSDLANSYDVVRAMRLVPFDKSTILRLTLLIAFPLLPLTFTMVPLDQMVKGLVKIFV
jgi:hypothetical protein